MRVLPAAGEYAINASNRWFWEPPVQRYIQECEISPAGVRGEGVNMRWNGALVADLHRILLRGGVFLYPWDSRNPNRQRRLRLLYEANPIAKLIEAAGGAASTGRGRVLERVPSDVHERTVLIFGSRKEVARLEAYHAEHDRSDIAVLWVGRCAGLSYASPTASS
jgi:fructose-1,6-bisphosphatase I/sedoheptulose-1,7-bisphosphatase